MQISKSFKHKKVLDTISINTNEGCRLVLGENGSGKTTMFRIISGMILHYDGDYEYKNNVSLLLDKNGLFSFKTGIENIEYFLDKEEYVQAMHYVQIFQMDEYINNRVKTYSNGMKKKLGLVIALSKNKPILLLDEPTNSLDVKSIEVLKEILISLKKEKCIFIASHDISIVNLNLIDEIYYLKDGHLIQKEIKNFTYTYYRIQLKKEYKGSYPYQKENNQYIMKIYDEDKEKFMEEISHYIPYYIFPIPVVDEMYLRGLYDEETI